MWARIAKTLILVGLWTACDAVVAVETLTVLGLFKNKAVVEADGVRRVLRVGETSPEGLKLISADSDTALIEIDGKRNRYRLGEHIAAGFGRPERAAVQVYPDPNGMYRIVGSIDGFPVRFLIDTGATAIAMNAGQARRLGIDFLVRGEPVLVGTASQVTRGYRVKLKKVTVGEISLRDVDAVVMNGALPYDVLLGMSFLGRLEMTNSGQSLELRKKF